MSDGVVIAGGGLAAQRCCETLRSQGYDGPIRILCAEPEPPYDRPPLSKELLAGAMPEQALRLRPAQWYEERGVDLLLSTRATALDAGARTVSVSRGPALRYDSLLIATGARARHVRDLSGRAYCSTLRTLADARALARVLRPGARLAIVGAGFIGLEVAATARGLGIDVVLVEAAAAPLSGPLGERVGGWFADFHRGQGVEVHTGTGVSGVSGGARAGRLELSDGRRVACDHVLVAVGSVPDSSWLEGSGLAERGRGVETDSAGRTEAPGVYAAGDVALAPDPLVGRPVRSEHWESAAAQGTAAARAMLGLDPLPPRLPSFWSDQHGVRIQCVGHPGESDAVTIEGDPGTHDFTALYTRAGRPVAALLVGRPRALAEARRLVQGGIRSLTPERSTT